MFNDTIKKDILDYINNHINNRFVIAVSGGMDSMALLSMCVSFNPIVVYFNHHKRDDVFKDVFLIESFSLKHNLTLVVKDVFVNKGSFQSEAHHLRQQSLIEIARANYLEDVMTGHHLDDQIETILMRLIRGSDISGYIGLKPLVRINDISFHKPMLLLSKDVIKSYVDNVKIPYHKDSSNDELSYFRNRMRHLIIPTLKEENPNLGQAFHKFHTQLSHLNDLYSPVQTHLSRREFISLKPYQQFDYLKQLFLLKHIKPTFKVLNNVHAFLHSNASTGQLSLKNNCIFVLLNDAFYIDVVNQTNKKEHILSEGVSMIEDMKVSIFYDNAPILPGSYTKVCYNEMALPLILRHPLPGDTLSFNYGRKKLKKHMIDLKIPKHKRDNYFLVCDQQHTIVWIEHLYINQTFTHPSYVYIQLEKETNHAT